MIATSQAEHLVPEGKSVKLVVSKGLPLVVIPPVVEQNVSDAGGALTQVGFLYTIHEVFNSTIANGVVISSTPDAGDLGCSGLHRRSSSCRRARQLYPRAQRRR